MATRRIEVILSPPAWVRPVETACEWALIAHVRLVECQREAGTVIVTVEGKSADVDTFKRIVRLNTAGW
ncbi:MAG: hypothetical protein ACYDCO_16035 [Armatimonadota bacterium]